MPACTAYWILGRLPLRIGGGWALVQRVTIWLSSPVGIRRRRDSSRLLDQFAETMNACSRQRRAPHGRSPRDETKTILDAPFGVDPLIGFQLLIPLVEENHQTHSGFDGLVDDPLILLSDTLEPIDQHDANVGIGQDPSSSIDRIEVGRFGDLGTAPDAGRVDQHVGLSVDLGLNVDRVAGGAGRGRHDHSRLRLPAD